MSRQGKIFLVSVFALGLIIGYGIYWWHETSLDRIAEEVYRDPGPALREVSGLLSKESPDEEGATARLWRLTKSDRILVLRGLSGDAKESVRLFAVGQFGLDREVPVYRSALATMAESDSSEKVREAAGLALGGGVEP